MVRIDAIDNPNIKVNESKAFLPSDLFLSIGCRVMLCINTCTSGGSLCQSLVNGLLGTIGAILYDENVTPPLQPYVILVEFDDSNGPCVKSRSFPNKPILRLWKKFGRMIT